MPLAPRLAAALALAALAGPVCAQASRDVLDARALAATCANCHGTDGRTAAGAPMRTLAGMPRDELLAELRAFRGGTRASTIMGQITKGYDDAQLERIATWLSAQR